jgi:uncharacterized protein YkwD
MNVRPVPVLLLVALACCACSGDGGTRVVLSPIHTGTTPLDQPAPPQPGGGVTILSVLMDDDGGLMRSLPTAINDYRRTYGLRPLAVSPQLSRAAGAHAHALAYAGVFQHEWPDGRRFDQWIRTYYKPPRHGYWSVGENLLWSTGATGSLPASQALALWVASPPHRAVLLTPGWKQLGIGAVAAADAGGVYGGSSVLVVAADFGAR